MTKLKAVPANAGSNGQPEPETAEQKRGRQSQANQIFECRLELYRDADGMGWGDTIDALGNTKKVPTATMAYRMWLAGRYYEKHGSMPGDKPLRSAHEMADHLARRSRSTYSPPPGFDDSGVDGDDFWGGAPDDKTAAKANELIAMLLGNGLRLFHANEDDGELGAYGDLHEKGKRKTLPIKSTAFKGWAQYVYYTATRSAVTSEVIKLALESLAARAEHDETSPLRDVSLRVATDPKTGFIYIDLGDESWRAVEIKPGSWSIVNEPPVRFRRSKPMQALPEPVRGGHLSELRNYLNIKDDGDFYLLCGALCCYLRPGYPYPVLVLQGEAGSAKSTATKILRQLVDPNRADLRDPPRKIDDLLVSTVHNHVITVENASSISTSLSDAICRLATGAGTAKRGLYTNHDEVVITARRPIIMNGIEFSMRDDLASRAVFVELTPILETDMEDEEHFVDRFEEARPRIFGALCDAIATGLATIKDVKPTRLPRMADFMRWGIACSPDFAPNEGDFEKAYWSNVENLVENVIEGDPVSSTVREFAWQLGEKKHHEALLRDQFKTIVEPRHFKGTSSELLKQLEKIADDKMKGAKGWPATGSVLSRKLRYAAPTLRKAGIRTEKPKRQGSTRFIEVYAAERPKNGDRAARGDDGASASGVNSEDFRD